MKNGCTTVNDREKRVIELPVLASGGAAPDAAPHSRVGRWRAAALIGLTVLMIAHFIQWQISGSTVSPIEPSETMFTLQNGAVNAGFIFFSLAILSTLLFGRWVCGWGCHIVALQDLCGWMMKKIGIKPRPFRSRLLVWVPLLAALYMFVWPSVLRYIVSPPGQPLFPQFTNHIITTDFWATFPPLAVAIPFLLICGFATVYFLGAKGFCTYACPYGGFFGIADKFAPGKIRVTEACDQCGHCTAVCTSNVIVHAEVREHKMVVDPGCMKCMDCVSACPTDALYFGFGRPSLGIASKVKKSYSLSWPEEIAAAVLFAASLLAVWDVYQLVPMLMALGIAGVVTFIGMRLWRLLRSSDLSLYRFNLKAAGQLKPAGWVFAAGAVIVLLAVAHSGFVRYHEAAGMRAYEGITIPDELALAQRDPAVWLSKSDKANIADGRRDLGDAYSFGLFTNNVAATKLAWMEYLAGNDPRSVELLAAAAEHQSGQARALSNYYRGAILNRMGQYSTAITSLDAALADRPDLTLALEQKGESLWQLGRPADAENAWSDAASRDPRLALTLNFLAGAAHARGDDAAADAYLARAAQATPNDALFHWVLGLRLNNVGMKDVAERHFARAIEINPQFRAARNAIR